MSKKFIGLILTVGLIVSGTLAIANGKEKINEQQKEKFILSENTIEETRLVKVKEVSDNYTIMEDLVGNEFEVETTTDYSISDTWFIKIDKEGIKEVTRKNNLDSSSELAHRARAKRIQDKKNKEYLTMFVEE